MDFVFFVASMALGIMPYISASIVVQLMGISVPYTEVTKGWRVGVKKITQITRIVDYCNYFVQGLKCYV